MAAIFILGVYKNNQKYFDRLVFYQLDVRRGRHQLSHKRTFICVIPKWEDISHLTNMNVSSYIVSGLQGQKKLANMSH